jgi:hypothetical protein
MNKNAIQRKWRLLFILRGIVGLLSIGRKCTGILMGKLSDNLKDRDLFLRGQVIVEPA